MAAIQEKGGNRYPHKFPVSHRVPDFVRAFADRTGPESRARERNSHCGWAHRLKLMYSPKPGHPNVEIDFTPPSRRLSPMEGLDSALQTKLPALDDPPGRRHQADGVARAAPIALCATPHHSPSSGKVGGRAQIMSPLAKHHRSKPFLTERFELFAAGKELANAHTELNDPVRQHELFLEQAKAIQPATTRPW